MKRKIIFKWVAYSVLLLIIYIMQETPFLFEIGGVKPLIIVPYTVCIAIFEGELTGCIYAVAAGLLWDSASGRLSGFSSLILMFFCITASLLIMYLIKINVVNAVVLSTATVLVHQMLFYFFYFWIWGYDDEYVILKRILSGVVYTAVISPLMYYAVKKLKSKFGDEKNQEF